MDRGPAARAAGHPPVLNSAAAASSHKHFPHPGESYVVSPPSSHLDVSLCDEAHADLVQGLTLE